MWETWWPCLWHDLQLRRLTDDETRASSKRFFDKLRKMPNMLQAAVYSSTMHYLLAVQATGTNGQWPRDAEDARHADPRFPCKYATSCRSKNSFRPEAAHEKLRLMGTCTAAAVSARLKESPAIVGPFRAKAKRDGLPWSSVILAATTSKWRSSCRCRLRK